MHKIFKYTLTMDDEQVIDMPQCAEILSVGVQARWSHIAVWALIDPAEVLVLRRFFIYGTGHEITNLLRKKYIGTVLDDTLVWHVFEEKVL